PASWHHTPANEEPGEPTAGHGTPAARIVPRPRPSVNDKAGATRTCTRRLYFTHPIAACTCIANALREYKPRDCAAVDTATRSASHAAISFGVPFLSTLVAWSMLLPLAPTFSPTWSRA